MTGRELPLNNKTIRTGTTKTATKADPIIAKVFVQTKGENNFFSCPSRNKMGLKETSVISMALTTALATSFDELSIFCSLSCFVILIFYFSTYRFHSIFNHHNPCINQIANGNSYTCKRHDIGCNTKPFHHNKSDQY